MRKGFLRLSVLLLVCGCDSPQRSLPRSHETSLALPGENRGVEASVSSSVIQLTSASLAGEDRALKSWMQKVQRNAGWNGEPSAKANPGRVRICGVYWNPSFIIAAVPARADTLQGGPAVEQVYLQFAGSPMYEWSFADGSDGKIVFWRYDGEAPERFQFSFALRQNGSQEDDAWG